MTFSEAVDIVLLYLNDGDLTDQGHVIRPDIEAYLPIAIGAALEQWQFAARAEARADASLLGTGSAPQVGWQKKFPISTIGRVRIVSTSKTYSSFPARVSFSEFGANVIVADTQSHFDVLNTAKIPAVLKKSNDDGSMMFLVSNCEATELFVTAAFVIDKLSHGDLPMPLPDSVVHSSIEIAKQHFGPPKTDAIITNTKHE